MFKKLLISLFFVLLVACSIPKYIVKEVPVEVTKTEYVYQLRSDSIYVHDSINVYIKGDTVFKDKIKYYYKTLIQRDTINVVDSIPVVLTTTEIQIKEVNKLKWYQRGLITLGIISLIILILYIILKVIKWSI